MILLGVGISIAVVVLVGFLVSKRIAGDSANFLVAGLSLPLILVGGALMGSAVDTNATLGNTDLASEFGFWAGACLPLGLALCLFLTGVFFAKPMNRMGLTSFPDYYRLRFGRPSVGWLSIRRRGNRRCRLLVRRGCRRISSRSS